MTEAQQIAQAAAIGAAKGAALAGQRINVIGTGQDRFTADAVATLKYLATGQGQPAMPTSQIGLRIATTCLANSGVNTFAMPQDFVAEQALGGSVNRPGDFPAIMSAAATSIMEDAAQGAATTFEQWADRLPDSDTIDPVSIGGAGAIDDLDDHVDGDDVKERKMSSEHKGWIQVEHQANDIVLTPLMVVDAIKFQGFLRMLAQLGTAGKRSLNRKMIALLGTNPTLFDGVALFHTSHGNLVASGAAPSDTSLRANRALHAAQRAPGSSSQSGVDPMIVLVPDALKITAETAFQTILLAIGRAVANVESSQQYFKDRIKVLSDPELDNYSASAWYSMVDPTLIGLRSFVYRYMAGDGPSGRPVQYFDHRKRGMVFGIDFKAGCAITKHRGVVKNPG
ncbi:MAG: hypothetical protein Q8M16_07185 [Pirellulaceae bacterium]|nr:hypothetical protein [Pirellulaceae bacterium]